MLTGTIDFCGRPHEHEDRNAQLAAKRAELEAAHGAGTWTAHVHDDLQRANWAYLPHGETPQ